MMFVAPVARIAFRRVCVPAAGYDTPGHVPPSRKHCQAAVVSPLLSGKGSLNTSKMTELLLLNVLATEVQKAGAWSASGIAVSWLETVVPGAAHCRSMMTATLLLVSRLTKLTICDW